MTTILIPDDKDLNATDAGKDCQGSTIKKIKFIEEVKVFEITAKDYNKGIKYCLKKYPYRITLWGRIRLWVHQKIETAKMKAMARKYPHPDIIPARTDLGSCEIRHQLTPPEIDRLKNSILSRIHDWEWRRKEKR